MRFLLRRLGPWGWAVILFQAALTARRHMQQTSPEDRTRLQQLLKQSGGRPSNLTAVERQELLDTARRLRPGKLLGDLAKTLIRPGRAARRTRGG